MIYDCFTLYNELDLLEIRLHTLAPVVDRFVIVEMERTYSGLPKPLFYQEHRERFAAFDDKIIHVVVRDKWIITDARDESRSYDTCIPRGNKPADHWQREYHQRNAILPGLRGAQADDVILISDVDEIPRPERITERLDGTLMLAYQQAMYYYNVNTRTSQPWWGTRAMSYQTLRALPVGNIPGLGGSLGGVVQAARYAGKFSDYRPLQIVLDGGWHFSHFGGAEVVQQKLYSGAHQEVNRPEWTDLDAIKQRIASGTDLFDRAEMDFQRVDADDLPAYLLANRGRFAMHFADGVAA